MSILSKNSCITVLDTYIQRSDHLHRIYKFLHIFSHVPISIQSIFLGVYVIYGPNIPITKDKRTLQAVVGALEIFWGLLSCSAYLLQYGRYSSEMQRAGNNLRKLKKLVLSEEDMEGMFVNILAHLNFIIQYSSVLRNYTPPERFHTPECTRVFSSLKKDTFYSQYVLRVLDYLSSDSISVISEPPNTGITLCSRRSSPL